MTHSNIFHCSGVSTSIAVMVGMDVALCKSCIRYAAHTEAQQLGIRTIVQYITPQLYNGCSHYKEVDYVDFEPINTKQND